MYNRYFWKEGNSTENQVTTLLKKEKKGNKNIKERQKEENFKRSNAIHLQIRSAFLRK